MVGALEMSATGPDRADLQLGTSSWSHDSWVGVFYPHGAAPGDYLRHYAQHYPTVEVDATFYRTPSERMVAAWREKTPAGFLFAAKVPRVITHDKILAGCDAEIEEFLRVMGGLGDRLGPLLLQFPYFRKGELGLDDFLSRLDPFLARLPADGPRFALEIRNKAWVGPALLERLAARGVALAWIDHPWFWDPEALVRRPGVLTAEFVYVRWLGDRVAIEKMTREWSRILINREERLRSWARALRAAVPRGRRIFGYFNNHYAGYAIGSIDLFDRIWRESAAPAPGAGP